MNKLFLPCAMMNSFLVVRASLFYNHISIHCLYPFIRFCNGIQSISVNSNIQGTKKLAGIKRMLELLDRFC